MILVWAMVEQASAAHPLAAKMSEFTVCPAGPPDCEYAFIQDAVNAASEGDVIKVAGGVYTDLWGYPAPSGYPNPPASGLVTQTVFVSKTLSIQGGYALPDFAEPPDPEANPTILDAQGQGRAILISGVVSPTLKGLRLTGGDAQDLGGFYDFMVARDAGGGSLYP
jgi:hypothetical protein